MAEEATAPISNQTRFFCHNCNSEFRNQRVTEDYICPMCQSGFIEALEDQPESDDEIDSDMEAHPFDLLNDLLVGLTGAPGSNRRTNRDNRHQRRRQGRDRPAGMPFENLIQDIVVNLTDVGGFGGFGANARANGPVLFVGNPGDYAWGREGLDAIVTQLLNQMDGNGPPPLAQDKIQEIPVVVITQDQVDSNLQCSVCWEDFIVSEPVRKLVCEHVYHELCIIPWLELHGTCPICRTTLTEEGGNRSSMFSTQNVGPGIAALFRAANDRVNNSQSTDSRGTSSSGSFINPNNMDYEYD